mmetsp:Transcript_8475/g.20946  ORF Transcript_8475/g.20946 Transcript_8475/m.20946 type:complete len:235 (-) Transcript_8475:681-1385(-)
MDVLRETRLVAIDDNISSPLHLLRRQRGRGGDPHDVHYPVKGHVPHHRAPALPLVFRRRALLLHPHRPLPARPSHPLRRALLLRAHRALPHRLRRDGGDGRGHRRGQRRRLNVRRLGAASPQGCAEAVPPRRAHDLHRRALRALLLRLRGHPQPHLPPRLRPRLQALRVPRLCLHPAGRHARVPQLFRRGHLRLAGAPRDAVSHGAGHDHARPLHRRRVRQHHRAALVLVLLAL